MQTALARQLSDDGIGVVVIFLGGNDLKSDYSGIFNDDAPPALLENAVSNLRLIRDFVRSRDAVVPIVICTFPDIGATPEVAGNYVDPVKRVRARQRIAEANAEVMAMAADVGAHVARVDLVTDRVFDEVPFYLNGRLFHYPPDPLNPADRLFCHDGFHPSTSGQALIANEVMDAINRATGVGAPLLSNREILGEVLGLNPDQPYVDWAGSAGGMTEDPDGDGVENLVEYLFGMDPGKVDSPFRFGEAGGLMFSPSQEGMRFAGFRIVESGTLGDDWTDVEEERIEVAADGTWTVMPNGEARNFYRLMVSPKP